MKRRYRIALAGVVGLAAVVVVSVMVIHTAPVQRWAWNAVTDRIEATTGVIVDARSARFRLWPARLVLEDLSVRGDEGTFVTVERIEAAWSWRRLTDDPPRLRSVELDDPWIDVSRVPRLPSQPPPATGPSFDPWRTVEIERFVLTGGDAVGEASTLAFEARDVKLHAGLVDASVEASVDVGRVLVVRHGRTLEGHELSARVSGGADSGLTVESLVASGPAFRAAGRAMVGTEPLTAELSDVELALDLHRIMGWWDPALLEALEPAGRLELHGGGAWVAGETPRLEVEHRGRPFALAGFDFDSLSLRSGTDVLEAAAAGSWGQADISGWINETVHVEARLSDPDLQPLIERSGAPTPEWLAGPVRVNGSVDLRVDPPYDVRSTSGVVDLRVAAVDAELVFAGSGRDGAWDLERVSATMAGARAIGRARLSVDGAVDASLDLEVPEPAVTVTDLEVWLPEVVASFDPGGGPLTGRATVDGTWDDPRIEVSVTWREPRIAGVELDRMELESSGDHGRLEWRLAAGTAGRSGSLTVRGDTRLPGFDSAGDWSADIRSVGDIVRAVHAGSSVPEGLAGRIDGRGTWSFEDGRWAVGGVVEGADLVAEAWEVGSLTAAFDVDPEMLRLPRLEVTGFGGSLSGAASVPLDRTASGLMDVILAIEGIDTAQLPLELPWWSEGTVSADVDLTGSADSPSGTARVSWEADHAGTPLLEGAIGMTLDEGVLTAVGDGLESAGGPVELSVQAPLGDVPRPAWLLPAAPGGPVRVRVVAIGLRVSPFTTPFFEQAPDWEITTDVDLEARWDLEQPEASVGELRLGSVVVDNAIEELRSEGPIVVETDGTQLLVRSAHLRSARSDIRFSGRYGLWNREVDLSSEMDLSAELVRLIPLPVRARGGFAARIDLGGSLDELTGRIEVDHSGGAVVMRDPAIELKDTRLVAVLEDGALWVEEGSAELNRGRVELGGGWDPDSGQGLVAQLEHVIMVLPMSILTRWSGDVAIEPVDDPNRIARVVGELVLESGLWDRPFDYTTVLLGSEDLGSSGDDPLYRIGLDVRVQGRQGVHVDNNLGEFDVVWDTLRIGGTAAAPRIVGDMRLEPGGRLALPGRTVTIRRGTVQFTGKAETDPLLEIVPVEDVASFTGGEGGDGLDVTTLAARGLASTVGTALGFENRTLTPAEIAVETETDTATRFSIGQRLSRNLALFFSTDLADPQSRKTLLQLWNLSWAQGLAFQVYDDTEDDEQGVNLIQRFRWGGTVADDAGAVIQRIRLEGDWPISKRRLRRASGLAKGQPFDPFLLFVAGLRMERELAEEGYFAARVESSAVGREDLPELEFRCDPGPRQPVVFEGDRPPRRIRREVTATYQPPPLENSSLAAMESVLLRHARSEGHIDAEVEVSRRGDEIVATVIRGRETELVGPAVDGVSDDAAAPIRRVLGTPSELARALADPDRTGRIIQRLMYTAGYHEARLVRVWRERLDEDASRVHLEIEAGPAARVAEVTVEGSDPLDLLAESDLSLREGMVLDRNEIDRGLSEIRSTYVERGWRQAEVSARPVEIGDHLWRLVTRIEPGERRTVRDIDVTGERHVKERYLREGIVFEPGDVLLPSELDASVVDAATFPPVEKIEVRTEPVGPDQVDVEFEITEKPRWTAELGAGWTSDRGALVRYGLRDDNLFGRGFSLNLRGQWQQDENLVLLYAILPPLPSDRLTLSSTLRWYDGDLRTNPDAFFQERLSLSLEASYRLNSNDLLRAYVERARTEQTFKDRDNPIAELLDSVDNESILGLQFVRDRLNNPFDPTSGYAVAMDLSSNMPSLGSDLADIRALGRGSTGWQPWDRVTWVQALRLGWAEGRQGDELVPDRRFFAGGQASIRGFDRDSVGPVQPAVGGLAPSGGGALVILNEEFRFRVWRQLQLAVFADAGQVWRTWSEADFDLSVGAGLGIRISTPIGPLWADVAWPVANVGLLTGRGPKYYVGIGRPF